MSLFWKLGKLLFRGGKLAFSLACCACGACPADCNTCPATLAVVISGLTGLCACINGEYTITQTTVTLPGGAITNCCWQYLGPTAGGDGFDGLIIDYRCQDGLWTLYVQGLSTCVNADVLLTYLGDFGGEVSVAAATPCPPLGTLLISASPGVLYCPGQIATVVVS